MEELCEGCNLVFRTLELEERPELEDTQKLTPEDNALIRAATHGHTKCLELLIQEVDDLNVQDRVQDHNKGTAMYHAAWEGHDDCVRLLVEAGADVNLYYEDTPIKVAASQGNTKCVKALIEGGADVNTDERTSPLHAAIYHKNPECALLLLNAGADVNIRDRGIMPGRVTPLMFAAAHGMVDILQAILEKGADVNATTSDQEFTALSYAAIEGKDECIEKLLVAGADVKGEHVSVLFIAAGSGCHIETIKLLLKAGARINLQWRVTDQYLSKNKREVLAEIAQLMLAAGEILNGTAAKAWHYWWGELNQPNEELQLKHMCREAIRKHLIYLNRHEHLFDRVPKLNLPKQLTSYLLYDVSL